MRISDWSSDVCSSDLGRDLEGIDDFFGVGVNLDRLRNALSTGQEAERPERPKLREQQDAQFPEREVAIQFVLFPFAIPVICLRAILAPDIGEERSEEHTSELQSLMRISYAVFCLKKKNQSNQQHNYIHS